MIRLFITLPVIVALIVFAACNQAPVELSWLEWKWTSSPGVLALLVAALFYATGSASVWIVVLRQMRRARRAEQELRTLRARLPENDVTTPRTPGLASAPASSPMVQAYAAGQATPAQPAPVAEGTAVTESPVTPERPPAS
ncbi:LapA family protein [Komagataeibacter sp. FNDCF1]|uniref:LapA family protein n=1 Tax=Komagataeibacter sp. FNDCF1 TaxID=2878681 RepID=UPI001E2E30B2|nr:LapA family protein [Komagataeibacter sp. FNDCF1]MCE2565447.1 LapA family protein [Komagataeibacter sp. FNDCF1]